MTFTSAAAIFLISEGAWKVLEESVRALWCAREELFGSEIL